MTIPLDDRLAFRERMAVEDVLSALAALQTTTHR
jgi:hypothetical protein